MCFFIAGVQPKTRTVDRTARRCPRCGLYQAHLRRTDHYISLFFIPLIPVQRGEPYLYCERCRQPVNGPGEGARDDAVPAGERCRHCGASIDAAFAYCPHCGQKQ